MLTSSNSCTSAAWSPDGRFFYVSVGAAAANAPRGSLAFPLLEGQSLPALLTEAPNANLSYSEFPGAQVIELGLLAPDISLGSDSSTCVFTKVEFHSNLFRIPIHLAT